MVCVYKHYNYGSDFMLLSYKDCVEKYGSDYQIKKEISNGALFLKEKGIYSTRKHDPEIEVILYKYPKAVFSGKSAFYYHSLTDVIPDMYYLATRRTDTRIKDSRIKQSFLNDDLFEAGITNMDYNGSTIRIYDQERMLIELMRFKSKIPMDYYKEIIQSFRKRTYEMDFGLVEEYASLFNSGNRFMEMIQMEVL